MKNRYDNNPGKEASMAKTRQSRMESMHNASDAFVKREQASIKAKGGKSPNMKAESFEFCSYMSNNGEHAQELARTITKGLDDAFPVK